MGNVAIWKPASTALYSAYYVYKIFEEAGLPPGVIQFLPCSSSTLGPLLSHPSLAGIHFTGSTDVFQTLWKTVGENISRYKTYPRLVGETGGKDFVFAHPSADPIALSTALIRGAFEYQGQKCSAASRAYIPRNIWPKVKAHLLAELATIRVGDVSDFKNFMGAVIDKKAFESIKSYITQAKKEETVLFGGECSEEEGYFIQPTVIEVSSPKYRTMCEEIFGPVLSVYVYDENRLDETLKVCDETSLYGLTGAIFSSDRKALVHAMQVLNHSAGNLYINNKPTGAIVGQQPFGGARTSGTNDKAGSIFNLIRWTSVRTVSETLVSPTDYRYPFLD
jgi:1-pyrroline-5-carboxylate dehydrogenase